MTIEERIKNYIQERDTCQEREDRAHKRKLELNGLLRKLHAAKRDLDKALEETQITAMDDLKTITENLK